MDLGKWAPLVADAFVVLGSLTLLKPWDPVNDDLDEPSVYSPLRESQFRLFALRPGFDSAPITGRLEEFHVKEPPSYYTLGYFRGEEPEIHGIVINDKGLMIRPNVF